MQIVNLKVSELKPYEKNHRTHPQKQVDLLAKNIERFGFTTPVLIDKNNVVIAGHGRLLALKQLNREEVPCVRMENLSDDEVKALRLADNQIALMGDTDMKLVIPELKELSEELLNMTGFDKDLIIEADENDDLIPENVPSRSKLGDLYELGQHRVLCGDSTQQEAVLRLMDGKKADMVFTDPPYGVSYSKKNDYLNKADKGTRIQKDIENDSHTPRQMYEFWKGSFTNLFSHLKGGGVYYICSPQSGDNLVIQLLSVLRDIGHEVRQSIIWVKNNHVLGMSDYHYKHEPILYGWGKGKHEFYGGRSQFSVWNFNKPNTSKLHPTTKPVELITYAISNSSKGDDLIADIFLGSGSTLIACEKTGRICYGCEIDPKYTDVIVQRYVDYVDNAVVKCNGEDVTKLWNKTMEN